MVIAELDVECFVGQRLSRIVNSAQVGRIEGLF
jgi:hypothetical protein